MRNSCTKINGKHWRFCSVIFNKVQNKAQFKNEKTSQKRYAESSALRHVKNLKMFFSSHLLFSVVSPFPFRTSLDWDILAFTAAFKLLLLGSLSLQCKAYLPFLFTGGQVQRGREGEKNTGNRKCALHLPGVTRIFLYFNKCARFFSVFFSFYF